MNKLNLEKQAQVIRVLCEGNSIRSTARITDTAINTVVKLLREVGAACLDYQDSVMHNLPSQKLQCDEIRSFVKDVRVKDNKAELLYTIPLPPNDITHSEAGVLSFVQLGRASWIRTNDRCGGVRVREGEAIRKSSLIPL